MLQLECEEAKELCVLRFDDTAELEAEVVLISEDRLSSSTTMSVSLVSKGWRSDHLHIRATAV